MTARSALPRPGGGPAGSPGPTALGLRSRRRFSALGDGQAASPPGAAPRGDHVGIVRPLRRSRPGASADRPDRAAPSWAAAREGARSRYSIAARSFGMMPIEPRMSFMKAPSWAAAPPAETSAAAAASAPRRAKARILIGPTILVVLCPVFRRVFLHSGEGVAVLPLREPVAGTFPGIVSFAQRFAAASSAAADRPRATLLEHEGIIEEARHAGNDRRVGDVENVPGEGCRRGNGRSRTPRRRRSGRRRCRRRRR